MIFDKIFRREGKPENFQNPEQHETKSQEESATQRPLEDEMRVFKEEWKWEVIVFNEDGSQLKGHMDTLPSVSEAGILQMKTLSDENPVEINPKSIAYLLVTNRNLIKDAPIKIKVTLKNNEELEIMTNYLPQSGGGIWGHLEGRGDIYIPPEAWKSFEQITKEGETKNPID